MKENIDESISRLSCHGAVLDENYGSPEGEFFIISESNIASRIPT